MLVHRRRKQQRLGLAAERGLTYQQRGLDHLPAELASSVLFALADGGHESHVATGELELGGERVDHTVFELGFQRDVRGEWAYLTTTPAFRLHSPATVLAYAVDRALPHTLIKRIGPSFLVAEKQAETFASLARFARDLSGIERAMEVAPPEGIPADPVVVPEPGEQYFVWSADAEFARELWTSDVQSLLIAPAAGDRDLVIELAGPLILLYCATDGRLGAADLLAMSNFADELCRRILAQPKS